LESAATSWTKTAGSLCTALVDVDGATAGGATGLRNFDAPDREDDGGGGDKLEPEDEGEVMDPCETRARTDRRRMISGVAETRG
jgi:hypothetical protein